MTPRVAYVVAAIIGALLWLGTTALTGRREAWDAAPYWTLAYPLGMIAAGALAFAVPHPGAWRIGLVLMLSQALTMAVTAGSFGLLPLGLVLCTMLAIPPATVATLASAVAASRKGGARP